MSDEVDVSSEIATGIYVQFMKCEWCYKTAVSLKAFMFVKSAFLSFISQARDSEQLLHVEDIHIGETVVKQKAG